ncbi:tetratricopeptide repeat protein [Virgibacillus halophilus]|uniref:Tetratricopeptide repeat protein n=1 Tax=Tigheibacillus halophilus TaxID=361280 RepID=A0ABU5CCZ3_9BACI|nr:tetratricopeptide repeat protein [Virgibacillus halophilus]
MVVQLPKAKKYLHQAFALILSIVLFVTFYIYGTHQTKHSAVYEWEQVNELMEAQDYDGAIRHATKGLEKAQEELKAVLLFKRAYAYTATKQPDKAIADYENSIQANPDLAESYYNLALLYMDKKEMEKAKISAKKGL